MSMVPVKCAKVVLIGSGVLCLSVGAVYYYFYKGRRILGRAGAKTAKFKRKGEKRSSSRDGSVVSTTEAVEDEKQAVDPQNISALKGDDTLEPNFEKSPFSDDQQKFRNQQSCDEKRLKDLGCGALEETEKNADFFVEKYSNEGVSLGQQQSSTTSSLSSDHPVVNNNKCRISENSPIPSASSSAFQSTKQCLEENFAKSSQEDKVVNGNNYGNNNRDSSLDNNDANSDRYNTAVAASSSSYNHSCDGEVSETMKRLLESEHQQNESGENYHASHSKNTCLDSPSVSSDAHSEGSQDSGKGTLAGLTSGASPVNDVIELPPMYEFEVPQDIVGLIIGRKGTTIKYFTQESGAHIVIRHHHYSSKHKICTIEGTREQINKCLRLIRHKFPPSRFPELKLTPLMPPTPVVSPHSPVFDSIVNLSLPEGISCEVILSSMVHAGHFFLQQPTHPTFPSLSRLDQYLLAVYSQPSGVPGLPRPIESGVICIAPVLGGWYRAQTVVCYDDTDEVLVGFVDYGGYCKIPASDLRQIRSDFMSLPFQSIECILAHVKPLDEQQGWSPEANEFFEQCAHGKLVEAILKGKDPETSVSLVELYSLIDGKTEMINRLLVEKGFAIWCESEEQIVES